MPAGRRAKTGNAPAAKSVPFAKAAVSNSKPVVAVRSSHQQECGCCQQAACLVNPLMRGKKRTSCCHNTHAHPCFVASHAECQLCKSCLIHTVLSTDIRPGLLICRSCTLMLVKLCCCHWYFAVHILATLTSLPLCCFTLKDSECFTTATVVDQPLPACRTATAWKLCPNSLLPCCIAAHP